MTRPLQVNTGLAAVHFAVNVYQFFIFPLVFLPEDPRWLVTLLPGLFLNNQLWSLIHETIHGAFHLSGPVNQLTGRLLCVCFGSPWRLLRTGHLLHHKLNRTPLERQELFDPSRQSRFFVAIWYYFHLFVGLYLLELLSPLAFFFVPRRLMDRLRTRYLAEDSVAARAAALLTKPDAVRELRLDGGAIYAILIGSAWFYGAYWWALVSLLAVRAFSISFLDYIYHYGSPIDDSLNAYNLSLPPFLERLLLNFNYHGIHHRHPHLPWSELPAEFHRQRCRYDGGYLGAALQQLKGPRAISESLVSISSTAFE
jgi:fatty acid desaturase